MKLSTGRTRPAPRDPELQHRIHLNAALHARSGTSSNVELIEEQRERDGGVESTVKPQTTAEADGGR